MRRRNSVRRSSSVDAGFTLLELLIASVIMGIVLVFVFGTMMTTQKHATAVDQTVEAQQSAKIVGDVLLRDLRHAGFMVSASAAICAEDNRTSPDRIFISRHDAIEPGTDLSADIGAVISGATVAPTSGSFYTVDSLVLEKATPAPAYDSDGDGTKDSDFQVNEGVIVFDAAAPERGTACGRVTGISLPDRIRVTLDAGGLTAPVVGKTPEITLVPAYAYSIDANNQLYRGRYLIANDVEDMQIAYFLDLDENNVVDANEYRGDGSNPDYSSQGTDAAFLREARVNVVIRTRDEQQGFDLGHMQAFENRTPVAGNDGFRRRVLTNTVRLRNLMNRNDL